MVKQKIKNITKYNNINNTRKNTNTKPYYLLKKLRLQ